MNKNSQFFDEVATLTHLKHYLPAQAPLKDFVHHNTLHSFQKLSFFDALQQASNSFGYKTALSINEYHKLYKNNTISKNCLDKAIENYNGNHNQEYWYKQVFNENLKNENPVNIGRLRMHWKYVFKLDLDMLVHPKLFKLIGAYLDQGVSEKRFPYPDKTLLDAIRAMQEHSIVPVFQSKVVVNLLFDKNTTITCLLKKIVKDNSYFEQYLFDQQFAHPGWSGMVGTVENKPETLLDKRNITLHDFIFLELLLEIESIEKSIGLHKLPIDFRDSFKKPKQIIEAIEKNDYWGVISIWQEALEWSYHGQVLEGLTKTAFSKKQKNVSFQAFFCIDDREESIRRHLEKTDPDCETYGTPGHFGMSAMYQPDSGKFYTQICPGSLKPKHLIREFDRNSKNKKDIHFHKGSHRLFTGWLLSQTIGFWSAIKLFFNLFRPRVSPAHSSAFEHMEYFSKLTIEHKEEPDVNGYRVGFTIAEMTSIVSEVLKSTGLTTKFAPIVYLIGHGGSSTNNPYYAGYNCGACSGRAGSVNARAVAEMANRVEVRKSLKNLGIIIPDTTKFLGGLHDTTRDEVKFYDEYKLSSQHQDLHFQYAKCFEIALENNSKERARQFLLINIKRTAKKVHKDVKERSTALFEPRPELNHSNNTLCIVGPRSLSKNVFLDQRAFLNSYDYKQDMYGVMLEGILKAATPVCGGINLEYYFSRVDNEKLGAGSKLPHNVIGLFGVANGIKGDLRPGLPLQMIDVHVPLRLMMIVEHFPGTVLQVIKKDQSLYEWYQNQWVKLAVIHPLTKEVFYYNDGKFVPYKTTSPIVEIVNDLESIFESDSSNLPVYQLNIS